MELPEPGKLFVARLPWEINETILKEYFNKYGEVKECLIITDKVTRTKKGYGFVTFTDPLVANKALEEEHFILGRKVDAKPAFPKGEKNQNQEEQHAQAQVYSETKKIFVGGLPHNLTQEEFKNFFEKFGTITDGVIIYDKVSGMSRGFGFIDFDSEAAVDAVMQKTDHELNDKLVEVKRAMPNPRKYSLNQMQTYDCDKVGLFFGRPQFGGCRNFCYYARYCYSCLVPCGYEHSEWCFLYGEATTGYVTSLLEGDLQTYVCSYDDPIYI